MCWSIPAAASLGRLGRQRVLDLYSERRMIEEHARLY